MKCWVLLSAFVYSSFAYCDRPLPFFTSKDLSPYWTSEGQVADKPATLNSLQALDQNGNPVTEKALDGKVTLVNFFFDKCSSLCPVMMTTIQKFQKKLKLAHENANVSIYSFSVMPEHDTPVELRQYAKQRGMDLSNWKLLTGARTEIYRVGKGVFKADRSYGSPKDDPSSFIHTSNIYVLDSKRRIRGIYDTQSSEQMELLAQDIAKLERVQ